MSLRRSDQHSPGIDSPLRTRQEGCFRSGGKRRSGSELKVALAMPGGPNEAGELVCDRYHRFVVATTQLEPQGPLSQPIQRPSGPACQAPREQHRTGTVDQQHPDIAVASSADSAEAPRIAGGELQRRQTHLAGEPARTIEAVDVTHRAEQSGRSQQSHARDGLQTPAHLGLIRQGAQLRLDPAHTGLQGPYLFH